MPQAHVAAPLTRHELVNPHSRNCKPALTNHFVRSADQHDSTKGIRGKATRMPPLFLMVNASVMRLHEASAQGWCSTQHPWRVVRAGTEQEPAAGQRRNRAGAGQQLHGRTTPKRFLIYFTVHTGLRKNPNLKAYYFRFELWSYTLYALSRDPPALF